MDDISQKTLIAMQDVLEKLLSGKQCGVMEVHTSIPELQALVTKMNQLIQNLNEINHLATDLSQGKLDTPVPPRHNYMASPLKQLHSQLSILTWSLRQLRSGYVVSKFENTGELFDACNELIDQVAVFSTQEADSITPSMSISFNSWRYHQILQTLNLLHVSVLEVDGNGRVIYANLSAKEIFGDIKYISEQTESNVIKFIATNIIIDKENNIFPIHQEIYEESSSTWYQITSDRFLLPNGQVCMFNVIDNISKWKFNECQLKMSAAIDEMTGAYNRKSGLEELENIMTRADSSKTHCIAFIDIDGLKPINDNYGHSEGDYAIKTIANVLLSSVRDSDVVCRYGGDEFMIIFKNSEEDAAEKIITRMCDKLKELENKTPKPYTMSFSYGITAFSNCTDSAYNITDLLKEADQKMYQYKTKKRRCKEGIPASVNRQQHS